MPNRIIPYNPKLKTYARENRKKGILAEVILWKRIQKKATGVEFHRQVPILNYIVDFYCHEIFLAIEVDGYSHTLDGAEMRDEKRQKELETCGVKFIRFNDRDIKYHMQFVLEELDRKIAELQKPATSRSTI